MVVAACLVALSAGGAVAGHGLFGCTKRPASSMKADSVVYDLRFTADANRVDGTVAITSTGGDINEKIIFERR